MCCNFFLSNAGIVKFHQVALSDTDREAESANNEENLTSSGSLLENYVQNVRDSFGAENMQLVLYVYS